MPSPARRSILEGRDLYEYIGRMHLDRSAGEFKKRFPGPFKKKFLATSILLHCFIVAAIVGLLALNFITIDGPGRKRNKDRSATITIATYNLDGARTVKFAPEPMDDFDKGFGRKSPGIDDEALAEDVKEALEAADRNPKELAEKDSSPSPPASEESAPASSAEQGSPESAPQVPVEASEAAEASDGDDGKDESASEAPLETAEGDTGVQEPVDDAEPLDERIERLVGHKEEAKDGNRPQITFEASDPENPGRRTAASKPKNFSYTQWKKYLQARAVIGIEGGKGSSGAVRPGGGKPEFFGEPLSIAGKRVVFVIDRSASMCITSKGFPDLDGTAVSGNKFVQARTELKRAVASLADDVSFTIIFFNRKQERWEPCVVKATDAKKDAAFVFIDKFNFEGDTDITSAILAAFSIVGKHGSIVFLTDGAPNAYKDKANEPDAAKRAAERIVQANVHRIPIHAFGFFHDNERQKGEKFLKRVASESGGAYVEVK